jgi:hypothetical protein
MENALENCETCEKKQAEINRLRRKANELEKELDFFQNAKAGIDELGRAWLTTDGKECRPIELLTDNRKKKEQSNKRKARELAKEISLADADSLECYFIMTEIIRAITWEIEDIEEARMEKLIAEDLKECEERINKAKEKKAQEEEARKKKIEEIDKWLKAEERK